jgi:acyl dehydratase
LYFEEFEVGMEILSPGRTITEADVVAFAGLSGDYNAIHTDAIYAQDTPFERRVAHGLLCLAVVSGLATRTGAIEGTVIAFREIRNWKFSRPVFIGDTIRAKLRVEKSKAIPRLGGGMVELSLSVVNQAEEETMSGSWSILVQSRPDPS